MIAVPLLGTPVVAFLPPERTVLIRRLALRFSIVPLVALSALLFPVSMAYPLDLLGRERTYYGLFLFLEAASLGVFLALDLFLFFVFWDLSLVGMYFVIAIWGHGDAARSAIKFFIYTLTGSLALLLA